MGSRRVNPHRVKVHLNYTARELADRLGIHKNTIRHWQHKGLPSIDGRRPFLFQGATVRAFLVARNRARKRPCPTGTLYCFKCREPRRPVSTCVAYIPKSAGPGNLRAICNECGTVMHRRITQSEIRSVLPGVLVQITQPSPRLNGNSSPSLNCDFERKATK